jgi:hypothetical protein
MEVSTKRLDHSGGALSLPSTQPTRHNNNNIARHNTAPGGPPRGFPSYELLCAFAQQHPAICRKPGADAVYFWQVTARTGGPTCSVSVDASTHPPWYLLSRFNLQPTRQAVDAYADGNWPACKALLRITLFFSAFRAQGKSLRILR